MPFSGRSNKNIEFFWIFFKIESLNYFFDFLVQQRYVVVFMMFLSMTFTFLLRMSFPIVLTQMVYIPNINSSSSMNTTESNRELICPVKNHMLNNTTTDPDPLVSFSVIYSIKNFFLKEINKYLHNCYSSFLLNYF